MPVLRSKVELCSRKLLEGSIAITKKLSVIQQAKIRQVYPDDCDTLVSEAYVPLDIEIPMHVRMSLYEAKKQIDEILEACKEDKGF